MGDKDPSTYSKEERKDEVCAGNVINHSDETKEVFWEVDIVVGHRRNRRRDEFLIQWKGCSEEENTWEPEANLSDTASKFFLF